MLGRRVITVVVGVLFAAPPAFAQKVPDGTKVERNLEYGVEERHKLDLYLPKADGPLPLIIWIHGGGWEGGSKDSGGPALQFLERGYAAASINYRLSSQAVFPAQIFDCKGAVRFLRANAKKYGLDTDRFAAMGGSAGGHLAALLGTSGDVADLEGRVGKHRDGSNKVQAVCDIFGPTDLARLSPPGLNGNPVSRLLGGDTGAKRSLAAQADPITHIGKGCEPFFILHGDQDRTVPVSQSQLLHDALKKANVESTLTIVPGAGHDGKVHTPETSKQLQAFFDKYLRKK